MSDRSLVDSIVAGDLDEVRRRLASGASPNQQTDRGHCPLHAAVSIGMLDMVRALLDAGARPSPGTIGGFGDEIGVTPLHMSLELVEAQPQQEAIALELISRGADVNARAGLFRTRGWRRTPLDYAIRSAHSRLVTVLTDAGGVPHVLIGRFRPVPFGRFVAGERHVVAEPGATVVPEGITPDAVHSQLRGLRGPASLLCVEADVGALDVDAVMAVPTPRLRDEDGADRVARATAAESNGGDSSGASMLEEHYRSVLEQAAMEGLAIVAIPCLSAGSFGVPIKEAAVILVRTVREFLKNGSWVDTVVISCRNEECADAVRQPMAG